MSKSKKNNIINTSLSLLVSFIFFVGILPLTTHASTLTSINPVADAMVKKDSPTNNYGTVNTLSCQGTDFRVSYMKFDLTQFAGKTIVSAKLRIKTIADGGASGTQNYKLVENNNWAENTITYNNSYNGSDATLKPSTTLASLTDTPSEVWAELPLTSIVSQKKGGMLSVACVPASTSDDDDLRINSKEASADKPALIVEYNNPLTPTPTKVASPTVTKTPTLTPTKIPTISKTPTPTPADGGFGGITLGQVVSGTIYVTFYSDQNLTNFMRFFVDNKFLNEEHEYPYSLGGDSNGAVNGFDTRQLTNGTHTLKAEIHYKDGTIDTYQVTFTVSNQTQVSPVCVPRIACPVGSTDPLCQPNIEPFGGWCPPVTISVSPITPTCIPRPACAMPNAVPQCVIDPPPGGWICPVTSPSPEPTVHPLSIKTDTVALYADDFYIIANGKKYYPKVNVPMSANSDPGNSTYTTLELSWPDGANSDIEMRLYMYFKADDANWWASELRTYDGNKPGDWIYYTNNFFSTPLGSTFNNPGEQIITINGTEPSEAMIFFKDLKLQAFIGQSTSPGPSPSGTTCALKSQGDANCDSHVDMIDFEIWREEFTSEISQDADFTADNKTDLIDFEAWREGFVARLLP